MARLAGSAIRSTSLNAYAPGAVAAVQKWFDGVKKDLMRGVKDLDEASADILLEALRPTFEKTQDLVPFKTGKLQASGFLVKGTGKSKNVFMGYARRGSPPYAIFVHENLEAAHAPPTQAKFFEQPVTEDLPEIINRVRLAMRKQVIVSFIKKGGK